MPVFIALLRGINVGGRNMVAMAALKTLHESLGFENVKTHLQSGNVVFTAKRATAKQLAKRIADALAKQTGKEIAVIVRTPDDLREVIAANPFQKGAEQDPSHHIVVFLSDQPTAAAKEAIDAVNVGPEQKELIGRELYVNYGPGMGQSKLTNVLIEKKLGVRGTARNWNTVTRLLEIAGA